MTRIDIRFAAPCLIGAIGIALLLSRVLGPGWAWLLSINFVTIISYRYDKAVAGTSRTRVPERVLLALAAVGGTPGAAVAMWLIRPRHKTRSADFLMPLALILAAQIVVGGVWFYAVISH